MFFAGRQKTWQIMQKRPPYFAILCSTIQGSYLNIFILYWKSLFSYYGYWLWRTEAKSRTKSFNLKLELNSLAHIWRWQSTEFMNYELMWHQTDVRCYRVFLQSMSSCIQCGGKKLRDHLMEEMFKVNYKTTINHQLIQRWMKSFEVVMMVFRHRHRY